jgi:hypothetical protein
MAVLVFAFLVLIVMPLLLYVALAVVLTLVRLGPRLDRRKAPVLVWPAAASPTKAGASD